MSNDKYIMHQFYNHKVTGFVCVCCTVQIDRCPVSICTEFKHYPRFTRLYFKKKKKERDIALAGDISNIITMNNN